MVFREARLAKNWGETPHIPSNAKAGQSRLARGENRAILTITDCLAHARPNLAR
jgi:hypothetical protein